MRHIFARHFGSVLVNGVAYVPAVLLAFVVAEQVIRAVNALPRHVRDGPWLGWLWWGVNVIPPLVVGALAFGGLASMLRRYLAWGDGVRGHLVRTLPLYGATTLNASWFVAGWATPDFGLWAQLPLWAGLVAVGGIVVDAAVESCRGNRVAAV